MHIVVFSTDDHLPPAGGAEIALREITKRCPEHTFHLFCARLRRHAPSIETVGNVTIERIGLGIPRLDSLLLALIGARRARAAHRQRPFQLIWSILASYGGFAGSRLARQINIPFLLTLQEGTDTGLIERRTLFIRPWFRSIFRAADGLQAISSYLLEWGKRMEFSGKIAQVVPNGIQPDAFVSLPAADRSAMRVEWNVRTDDVLLVTASRLVPKNGIGDVVAALRHLPNNVRLLICGDGPLRSRLERDALRWDVANRITFAGFVPHEQIPDILAASDIFVRPSLSEGLGNAFLEAMAAGIPVIGTAVGGITDFLRDRETGFVCRSRDPENLAQTVKHIIALGPERRQHVVVAARTLVHERFNWERIATDMKQLFTTLT